MTKTRVSPMRRVDIRQYAMKVRHLLKYNNKDFVNPPKLFDALSIIFNEAGLSFDYRVLPDEDKIFEDKEEAYTDMSTGIIYVKEGVMDQACRRRYKRGAFTLIHELGHYLLHYVQNDVRLTHVSGNVSVPIYCNPEWQADTFASEFLMPFDECIDMEAEEIRSAYHVSRRAAEVRYNKIKEEISNSLSAK